MFSSVFIIIGALVIVGALGFIPYTFNITDFSKTFINSPGLKG